MSDTLILRRSNREDRQGGSDHQFVAGLMKKLLQRGLAPLPSLEIERQAIEESNFNGVEEVSNEVEFEWSLNLEIENREQFQREFLSALCHRQPFCLDPQISNQFDREAERKFIYYWVPEQLGPD
ncbi:MAG: hypothetical protein F4Y88_05415, partial [Chloroflexi bacterium]|nr:hypothetical protein [Chloroflexota bacterium]